jgi:hypothetical protein
MKPSVPALRPFTLTVDLVTPHLVLSQRSHDGHTSEPQRLVTLDGARAKSLTSTVVELLHKGGFSAARLEERGRGRVRLSEAGGARLTLLLWALGPIQKPSRAALVRAGVAALTDEEVYYWYAKAQGHRGNALKALRILLAGE